MGIDRYLTKTCTMIPQRSIVWKNFIEAVPPLWYKIDFLNSHQFHTHYIFEIERK